MTHYFFILLPVNDYNFSGWMKIISFFERSISSIRRVYGYCSPIFHCFTPVSTLNLWQWIIIYLSFACAEQG